MKATPHFPDDLPRWADVPAAMPEKARRHLEECETCRAAFEGAQALILELRRVAPPASPTSMDLSLSQILSALKDAPEMSASLSPAKNKPEFQRVYRSFPFRFRRAIPALLLLAACAGGGLTGFWMTRGARNGRDDKDNVVPYSNRRLGPGRVFQYSAAGVPLFHSSPGKWQARLKTWSFWDFKSPGERDLLRLDIPMEPLSAHAKIMWKGYMLYFDLKEAQVWLKDPRNGKTTVLTVGGQSVTSSSRDLEIQLAGKPGQYAPPPPVLRLNDAENYTHTHTFTWQFAMPRDYVFPVDKGGKDLSSQLPQIQRIRWVIQVSDMGPSRASTEVFDLDNVHSSLFSESTFQDVQSSEIASFQSRFWGKR